MGRAEPRFFTIRRIDFEIRRLGLKIRRIESKIRLIEIKIRPIASRATLTTPKYIEKMFATDADREGELVARWIIAKAKGNKI